MASSLTLPSISRRLLLPAILLLTCLAYANILSHPFVADDPDFILNWPTIRSLDQIDLLFSGDLPSAHTGNYRPVRSLAYVLLYQLSGTSPFTYHLFSVSVHLTNVALVYFISRRLSPSPTLAFLATLFFGLHPLHTEAVTFITASFDTLAFIFLFSAFLVYLQYRQHQQTAFFWVAVVLAFLAHLTNETTLIFPLLLWLYHFIFTPSTVKRYRPPRHFSVFFVLPLIYFAIRFYAIGFSGRDLLAGIHPWVQMTTNFKALWLYLWQFLFPVNLSLSHTLPGGIHTFTLPFILRQQLQHQSLTAPANLFFWLATPTPFLLALLVRSGFTYLRFAALWIVISLLPVLNLILPGSLLYSERYAYLASLGFCFLLASFFARWLSSRYPILRFFGLALLIALTSFYFSATRSRNLDWQSDITLHQATVQSHPQNPIAHLALGRAFQYHNQIDQAVTAYHQALSLNNSVADAHFQLARIYQSRSQLELAAQHFAQALSIEPQNPTYRQEADSFCQLHPCSFLP